MAQLLDPQTAKSRKEFEDWFIEQILRAKAVWMHCVYRAILPERLYNLAAQMKEIKQCSEYARAQGYTFHEFKGTGKGFGGLSEMRKNGLTVAQFIPKLVGEKEDVHLEIEATVLGNPIDILALMKNTGYAV